MAIIQWTPTNNRLLNDFDRFFDDAWLSLVRQSADGQRFSPAINVSEDGKNIIVETQLAGIDPKNVSINVEDSVLTISGQHEQKREVDDQHFYRREIRQGEFYRSVVLPKAVNVDAVEATYDKGMLTVILPKVEDAKPKTITIQIKQQ